MSRIGKKPIVISKDLILSLDKNNLLTINGPKGILSRKIHSAVLVNIKSDNISVSLFKETKYNNMQLGTSRSLINNMVIGVSQGFEKKLLLLGVGYRAKLNENILHLSLGFSHPVYYTLPKGITAILNSPTEVLLSSINKELLGQISAEIRSYRAPEVYKGKGIRYSDEKVITKEAKKK